MSETVDTVECQQCGDEVPREDAVFGQGDIEPDGARRLAGGETVPAEDVFTFDEPYCSFDCLMESGSDGDS